MSDIWYTEMIWTYDGNGEKEFMKRVYEDRIEEGGARGSASVG